MDKLNFFLSNADLGNTPHVVLVFYLIILLTLGIFGYLKSKGTEEDYYTKTDNVFICTINEEQNKIKAERGPSLPFAEGFWSQQAIATENSVFMLQNVAHLQDENCV